MSEGRTCKFCGQRGLEWDQAYHSRTGRWRLEKHSGCMKSNLRYGNERCSACKWNGNKVCDWNDENGHIARI